MRINTNIQLKELQRYSRWGEINLVQATERLSSGRKINHGADDPSGLAISKELTSNRNGIIVSNQNIQDAISFLQIRDAATNQAQNVLLRLRDIAIRASNEATLTSSDIEKLNYEALSLLTELGKINKATTFNNKSVFRPIFETVPGGVPGVIEHSGILEFSIDMQSYLDENGQVTISATWFDGWADFPDINLISPDGTEAFGYLYVTHQNPEILEAYIGDQLTGQFVERGDPAPNAGQGQVPAGAVMDSADRIDYTGWGGLSNREDFVITNPVQGIWKIVIDNQDSAPHKYGLFINEPAMMPIEFDRIQIGPSHEPEIFTLDLGFFEVNSMALKLNVKLDTGEDAGETIDSVDSALDFLADKRMGDGIILTNLGHVLDDNIAQITNLAASNSRIEDADMAAEIAVFTKDQIIAQTRLSAMVYSSSTPLMVGRLIDSAVG